MPHQNFKTVISEVITTKIPRVLLSPIRKYRRDGHNEILFADLQLDSWSIVLDFGGFIGEFTNEIRSRFDSEVYVFEPVPEFFESLKTRFENDDKVQVHNYAVGSKTGELILILQGEATREVGIGDSVACAVLTPHDSIIKDISEIALIAINIEGGEYDLIPALSEAGIFQRTDHLLIQFHKTGREYREQKAKCNAILQKTHEMKWCYEYVWESWMRVR